MTATTFTIDSDHPSIVTNSQHFHIHTIQSLFILLQAIGLLEGGFQCLVSLGFGRQDKLTLQPQWLIPYISNSKTLLEDTLSQKLAVVTLSGPMILLGIQSHKLIVSQILIDARKNWL